MHLCHVYQITCTLSNKHYVGISNDVARRFKEHVKRAYCKTDSSYDFKLPRAIRKYGESVFCVRIIVSGCREFCGMMETLLIQTLDCCDNGYNSSTGGEGTSYYSPWNKGTKGLCKANRTSFVKGGKSARQKLSDEDILRVLKEYSEGVKPKNMEWLPVHWSNAYRTIRRYKT